MTSPLRKATDPGASERDLFGAYYPRVKSFFFSRGLRTEEVEDLTQEVLVRVFQHMGKLRRPGAIDSWLIRICANVWKNDLRRSAAKKRDASVTSLEARLEEGFEPADPTHSNGKDSADALTTLLANEALGAMRSCFEELPAKMRRCMEMHIHQNRTYDEIATLLHVATQTVKSHIHQGKDRLRSCTERKLGGRVTE